MIFVTIAEVDVILGVDWAAEDKKAMAVNQANVWLSTKNFCGGINPISGDLKQAGAYLASMSSKGTLYVSRTDGLVTEKTVKAGEVSVSKKFATGQEGSISSDMLFIDDLISPFLCKGVGFGSGRVCK